MGRRTVTDAERRRRLARRHAVAPGARVATAEAATRAVVVLHATEPATVHLSLAARVSGPDGAATDRSTIDRALHEERTLVRQLAMRRTLFVAPHDLLGALWGSASARVAATEAARVAKDAVAAGLATDGDAWREEAAAAVLGLLADHPDGLPAAALREALPAYARRVDLPSSQMSLARVLTVLGARAEVLRGRNTGHWRVSRPRWVRTADWLDDVPAPLPAAEGYAVLVGRWLAAFGPGTAEDLAWWLGATKGAVAAALRDVGAVEVDLEDGRPAYVAADDLDEEPEPGPGTEPWAALLPVLDPTVMGWKERGFYLGGLAGELFDRNGNAGTTVWSDGRVVGCWVQDPEGRVVPDLLVDVGPGARAAIAAEAERWSTWLDGERVGTVYPSSAMKRARAAVEVPR